MTTRPDASSQCEWALGSLARNFFTTSSEDSLVFKCRKNEAAAHEVHHQLWPSVPVPSCQRVSERTGGQLATAHIPTSVMIAYVLHMCTSVGRRTEYRKLAFGLLRALFDRAMATGRFEVEILHYSTDLQAAVWTKQRLQTLADFQPWTQDFFNTNIVMQWSLDAVDANKPCVTSLAPNIHPADFVCFTMDCFRELRRKMPVAFNAKLKLQGVALSLMTQLTLFLDTNLTAVTLPLQSVTGPKPRGRAAPKHSAAGTLLGCFKRAKRTRTSTTVVWETCSRVAEMLFTQQDGLAHDRTHLHYC